MEHAFVLCDRWEEVHIRDERLHNENGPAFRYRDGFEGWYIDGVEVDDQIVLRPETKHNRPSALITITADYFTITYFFKINN